jgi:hypothetical protein
MSYQHFPEQFTNLSSTWELPTQKHIRGIKIIQAIKNTKDFENNKKHTMFKKVVINILTIAFMQISRKLGTETFLFLRNTAMSIFATWEKKTSHSEKKNLYGAESRTKKIF